MVEKGEFVGLHDGVWEGLFEGKTDGDRDGSTEGMAEGGFMMAVDVSIRMRENKTDTPFNQFISPNLHLIFAQPLNCLCMSICRVCSLDTLFFRRAKRSPYIHLWRTQTKTQR